MRAAALALVATLAVVCCQAATPAPIGPLGVSSPLLVWSNRPSLGPSEVPQVSYEVVSESEAFVSNLMLAALGKLSSAVGLGGAFDSEKLAGEQHSAVVVFVGSQLTTSSLRVRGASADQLNSILGATASSVVLPYTHSQAESIKDAVSRTAEQAGLSVQMIGCGNEFANLQEQVSAALQQKEEDGASVLQVLVVCSQVPMAQDATPAGAAFEVAQLQQVKEAVDAAGVNHLFVYASEGQAPGAGVMVVHQGGRSLMQADDGGDGGDSGDDSGTTSTFVGFGEYTHCDLLCKTEVAWLQGMLTVLFLALASCAGLVCLYVLDTPSRFETAKEFNQGQ